MEVASGAHDFGYAPENVTLGRLIFIEAIEQQDGFSWCFDLLKILQR